MLVTMSLPALFIVESLKLQLLAPLKSDIGGGPARSRAMGGAEDGEKGGWLDKTLMYSPRDSKLA